MVFPPECYIIGAQRTGTTTLAHLLDQHPAVTLSRPKEPAFFTINRHRGLEWYRTRFAGDQGGESVWVDATTWYAVSPTERFTATAADRNSPYVGVPERIHALRPRAKFIYVLRDPVKRIFSAYRYYDGRSDAKSTFREIVDNIPWYLRGSDYYGQLKNYLEYFPIDSFLILFYEEIIKNWAAAARRCFMFLDVDPAVGVRPDPDFRNPSFRYTGFGRALGAALGSEERVEAARRITRRVVPKAAASLLDRALTEEGPPMSETDRAYLQDIFHDQGILLEGLLNRRIRCWRI